MRSRLWVLVIICLITPKTTVWASEEGKAQIGNPASIHCVTKKGGTLLIITEPKTGGQYGICKLSEELAMEEWCLYRSDSKIEETTCPNLILQAKHKQQMGKQKE